MSGTKIRGITIEIGGDASGLNKALKDVNKELNSTQSQLKDVERLLKLDPKNTELLRQKQVLLTKAIEESKEKLDVLQKAEQELKKSGVDENSEQFMALSREIETTKRQVSDLEAKLKPATNAIEKMGNIADSVATKAGKVAQKTQALSAAAGGLVIAVAKMGIDAATNADDLNTLAKQTGFTTEEIQKMQYAADLVDVSFDTISGASKRLKKNLTSSSNDVAEAFQTIGVETKDANGEFKDFNNIFFDVLDGLSKIENETERDTVAITLFGRSADELAGIVDDGGKALKELGDQASYLGLILDKETLDALNKTNDEIDTLKANVKGNLAKASATALQALTPVIEKVVGLIQDGAEWLGSLDEKTINTITTVALLIAALSPVARVVQGASMAIKGLSGALSFLAAHPVIAAIAAVTAVVAACVSFQDKIQSVISNVRETVSNFFEKDWTEILGPVAGGALNILSETVGSVATSIIDVLSGVISFIGHVFSGDWSAAWEDIRGIFVSIWEGLKSVLIAPVNGVISIINGLIDAINIAIDGINFLLGWTGLVDIGHIGKVGYLSSSAGQEFERSGGGSTLGAGAGRKGSSGKSPISLNTFEQDAAIQQAALMGGDYKPYQPTINVYAAQGQSEKQIANEVANKMYNDYNKTGAVFK